MSIIEIYLTIHNSKEYDRWVEKLNSALKTIIGIEDVMTIGQNGGEDVQLNLNFDINLGDFKLIERSIAENGGTIASFNVHFSNEVTGISDAYGASAVSLPITEKINKVMGVLGASVSSSGIIKVEMASASSNKDAIIKELFRIISERKIEP